MSLLIWANHSDPFSTEAVTTLSWLSSGGCQQTSYRCPLAISQVGLLASSCMEALPVLSPALGSFCFFLIKCQPAKLFFTGALFSPLCFSAPCSENAHNYVFILPTDSLERLLRCCLSSGSMTGSKPTSPFASQSQASTLYIVIFERWLPPPLPFISCLRGTEGCALNTKCPRIRLMFEHLVPAGGAVWGGCAAVKSWSLSGGSGSLAAGFGASQPSFTSWFLHCFLAEYSGWPVSFLLLPPMPSPHS